MIAVPDAYAVWSTTTQGQYMSPIRAAGTISPADLVALLKKPNSILIQPDNRTAPPPDIDYRLAEILRCGDIENPEDVQETEFSRKFLAFIDYFGSQAISALGNFIEANPSKSNEIHEALRLLGQSEHTPTHNQRRRLLERSLLSHSPRIRYGAILGLASMNDVRSTGAVLWAATHEKSEILQNILVQLLDQLKQSATVR